MARRSLIALLALLAACGTSLSESADPPVARAAPTTEPAPIAPTPTREEPPPSEPEAAPIVATPTPTEQLLAARADGTAVLVLHVEERRFVVLGPADTNDANDGETLDTAYGHMRLEDGAPVVTPRTLALVASEPCAFHTTRTFRAEVWTDEDEGGRRALYLAEGSVDDCDVDEEGSFAILGDTLPTIDALDFDALDRAGSRAALARVPRATTPRPRAGSFASAATLDEIRVVVAYSEPDEDGCAYGEVTYVVRPDGTAAAVPGSASSRAIRIAGVPYLWVVEASTAAGRPATHARAIPLGIGPALLDTDVLVPWMTGPNC